MTYAGKHTLICRACGYKQNGHLIELDKAGWSWFTGYFPKREEYCPKHAAGSLFQERLALSRKEPEERK